MSGLTRFPVYNLLLFSPRHVHSGGSGTLQTLLQHHDELTLQRRTHDVFYDFVEPPMGPDFYPTYKKVEGHGVPDRSSPDWTASVYHTLFKEPLYKGGRTKQRVPGWCDRVLVHSMKDLAGMMVVKTGKSTVGWLHEMDRGGGKKAHVVVQ